MNPKIISRIQGGVGNQLFCYAAARRMAVVNNCELVLDDKTGFKRDKMFRRSYLLDHFNIPCRKATFWERMEPYERVRRYIAIQKSNNIPFNKKKYIKREMIDYDPRILELNPLQPIYIDGVWLSEKYFEDIEPTIRKDLTFRDLRVFESDDRATAIRETNSVAVHFRFFEPAGSNCTIYNMNTGYYARAIKHMREKVEKAVFYVFSDDCNEAKKICKQQGLEFYLIDNSRNQHAEIRDLFLMTKCKHFIIANSTFSWWGAWLCEHDNKIIVCPNCNITGLTSWGFYGLIPERWLQV